jgi:hypothetical protein
MKRHIATLGAALLLAGCSSGPKGTYLGGDDSFLRSMTFKDDNKVDVVLINGIGGEGTFEVDGDKVRVSANGSITEFTLDDDCLRGPLMAGTLCKGDASSSESSGQASSGGGGGLSGSTFEVSGNGGRMAFEFLNAQSVRLVTNVPGAGASGSIEGTYGVIGDQVVITMQGQPQTFTLDGNTLSGDLDGDRLVFQRK